MERKWKSKEVERQRGSTEEATVRRRREERGKEETEGQVARTGTKTDERKWKERMRNQAGEKEETEEARAETGIGEATVRQNREEKERKKQKAE